MRRNLYYLSLFAILSAPILAGCCCGGDKEAKVVTQPVSNTTTGQELQDLKDAHDKGAITDKEYEEAKEKILKGQ